jgi:hypothetical protein
MRVTVECYAGRKGDERPVRFTVGAHVYQVDEVVGQWYGPDDEFFRVRSTDGKLFVLRHRRSENDEWMLESASLANP